MSIVIFEKNELNFIFLGFFYNHQYKTYIAAKSLNLRFNEQDCDVIRKSERVAVKDAERSDRPMYKKQTSHNTIPIGYGGLS